MTTGGIFVLDPVEENRVFSIGDQPTLPDEPPVPEWALFETNYEPDDFDKEGDPRRTAGVAHLNRFGRDFVSTNLGLYALLTSPPVWNDETAFSAILNPSDGTCLPMIQEYVPNWKPSEAYQEKCMA